MVVTIIHDLTEGSTDAQVLGDPERLAAKLLHGKAAYGWKATKDKEPPFLWPCPSPFETFQPLISCCISKIVLIIDYPNTFEHSR